MYSWAMYFLPQFRCNFAASSLTSPSSYMYLFALASDIALSYNSSASAFCPKTRHLSAATKSNLYW
jgi:hypothetical protein